MKKIIILILFSVFCDSVFGQLSNKHWLPPLHANESQDGNLIEDHYLYLSTPEPIPFQVSIKTGDGLDFVTPVTISQGNPAVVFIGSGQPSVMLLDRQEVGVTVTGKGLILEGQFDFYANFRVRSANHAEFLSSKGRTGAGNTFRLGSLPQSYSSSIRNFVSSVMATEDNTTITISDYNPGVSFIQGFNEITAATQSFTLNAGQSVIFSGYLNNPSNYDGFIGALLQSNKPVVVNTGNLAGGMGNQPAGGGSQQDFNLDQIVPLNQVGMEYIIMKGNGSNDTERPLVVAHEDNTEIFINGDIIPYATINAGEYFLIPTSEFTGTGSNLNMYIKTSKPAYLYQIVGGSISNATAGFYFIPPLSCFWQKSVDLIPFINEIGAQTDFTGNIIIATEIGSTVTINGNPIATSPNTVLGNPNWVTYRVSSLIGNVSVNSTGALAVGVFSASGNAGLGGYFSGFGSTPSGSTIDVCTGAVIDLYDRISGNPEPGGDWYYNGVLRNPNNGLFDPAVDPIGTYTYEFTKTCDGIDRQIPIDIVINSIQPGPNAGVSSLKSYCITDLPEDLFSLLGSNVTPGGNWTFNGIPRSNGILNPATDQSGSYTYTIPAQGVCEAVSASVTVTINPSPQLAVVTDLNTCDDFIPSVSTDTDGSTVFNLLEKNSEIIGTQTNVTVKYYFQQSDAENESNNNITLVRANSGTTVYFRIENNFGCYQIGSFNLVVNPIPVASSQVTLRQCSATNVATANFVLTEANNLFNLTNDPTLVFSYHTTQQGAFNNSAIIVNPSNYIGINGGSVWARIQTSFGCIKVGEVLLVVSTTQLPNSYSPQPLEECDEYVDNSNLANDGYDVFNLEASFTQEIINLFPQNQQLIVTYYESFVDAELIQNPISNPSSYINSIPGGQPIWARVDSQLNNDPGCKGIQELQLIVNPIPDIQLGENFFLCVNPTTGLGSQIIDATPVNAGSNTFSYVWSTDVSNLDLSGITTATYNVQQQGTYNVIVTNNQTGCVNSDSIIATYSSEPASFSASVTTEPFAPGLSTIVGIAVGGFGIYEYSLDLISWQSSPVFDNLPNDTYTLYVRDIQGCGILSVSNLIAITYPNFFTPNGDGFNDFWNISNLPDDYSPRIFIFDRYGKLLKQINSNGVGWDGSFNGEPLPSNDYWFTLEYTINGERKEFKSHFSLKR